MKKQVTALLSLALISAMAIPTFAADALTPGLIAEPPAKLITQASTDNTERYVVRINGKDTYMDARITDACIMVPLHAIAKELGFKVTENNGSILVDDGTMHTNVTIGTDAYFVTSSIEGMIGMRAPFSLGGAPFVTTGGVAYVPLSLFDALLGSKGGFITVDGNKIILQPEGKDSVQSDDDIGGNDMGMIAMPSPFVDYDTLTDAGKIAGFSMTVPKKMPEGYTQYCIQTIGNDTIQVFYINGEKDITIRKAKCNEDISGDYNEYKELNTLTVGNLKVSAKGNNGKINTATWVDGEYSYSVTANLGETGLDTAIINEIVSAVR